MRYVNIDTVISSSIYNERTPIMLKHVLNFQLIFAILGIIGNVVAILVLRRPAMRNPFNYLLIALAFIDIAYLFVEILRCSTER